MKKHEHVEVEHPQSAPETPEATSAAATPEPGAPEERIARLEEQLAAKEAECRENWDRFVRERADLENYRKRASREKEELLNYGIKSLIEDMLPVMDNLERALGHANEDGLPALVEGIRLTCGMFTGVLKKYGVTPVEAAGAPFDPTYHQAMTQVPTDAFPPNMVVEEFQKGYMLRDRLLRPAMVSVSSAPKGGE